MTESGEHNEKPAEAEGPVSLSQVKQSFLFLARQIYRYLLAATHGTLRRVRARSAATWSRRSALVRQWRTHREQWGAKLPHWRPLGKRRATDQPIRAPDSGAAIAPIPPNRRYARAARIVVATSAALAVLLAAVVFYSVATLPISGGLQIEGSQSALTIEGSQGEVFATRGMYKGDRLTAADLPANLAQAIVSIEDRRFYQHWGVDLRGILRAGWRNSQAGGTREGGSTITQQLARLMFLSQERSLRRKIQEAALSVWLEHQLSKDDILLRYLNTAYFGAGAYGVDAAAKRYFGKRAKDLSLGEAAMLAGLVRAPSQLAPTRNFGGAKERQETVLQTMVETKAITPAEADAARLQRIDMKIPPETPPGTNYFVDMVAGDVRKLLGSASGDFKLRTTLNLELQRLAEGVIERRLEAEGGKKSVSQAALVALGRDGAVLAMVGGRDYESSQFNRATQAKRQPGSLFKLFVYLTALQRGYTPQTVLTDRPTQIGDWEPQNYGGSFRGNMTLRTAFANSVNTIAAQLANEVGIPAVIETAKQMGVQSNLPAVPSLALGSAEVTLMEMTKAFAVVTSKSKALEPFAIQSISGAATQSLYTRPNVGPDVTPQLADSRAMMLDMLQAVVTDGTGKAARIPNVAVAGKTGTTQDYRDAWFVGFTPQLIVGVWVGNDDNSSTNKVTGGDMPANIWHDFVSRAGPALSRPTSDTMAKATARPAGAPPLVPLSPNELASSAEGSSGGSGTSLRGPADVVDTAILSIRGQSVRLLGLEGDGDRRAIRPLTRFLRRREVVCEPTGKPGVYQCNVAGQDLSELILSNGGARASPDASTSMLAAEEEARSARLGLWRRM
ncbi:MAG: penicillin-binding protein [Tardiphaga sp.]|nr:penicillin-binding protein [Tardiphaga sp.]